jgi:hypothetical protein
VHRNGAVELLTSPPPHATRQMLWALPRLPVKSNADMHPKIAVSGNLQKPLGKSISNETTYQLNMLAMNYRNKGWRRGSSGRAPA